MVNGKKLAMTAGDVATLPLADNNVSCFHRLRLKTGVGFDRTITIKKRPVSDPGTTITALAAWYQKETDKTIGTAPLAPGASNESEYVIDGIAAVTTVEVSGGTTGTVDTFWTTVIG